MSAEKIAVSDDLANDPNYLALQAALASGQFAGLEPEILVAYYNGQLVGQGMDISKLLQELGEIKGDVFITPIAERRVVMPRHPAPKTPACEDYVI